MLIKLEIMCGTFAHQFLPALKIKYPTLNSDFDSEGDFDNKINLTRNHLNPTILDGLEFIVFIVFIDIYCLH